MICPPDPGALRAPLLQAAGGAPRPAVGTGGTAVHDLGAMPDCSTMSTALGGRCDGRFEEVRAAFATNFAERGEVGAAVCVIVDGKPVVDLVGGLGRPGERRAPGGRHPGGLLLGRARPFVGLLALQLVDAGLIGLDDPIASVWPEFGRGKGGGHRCATPCATEPGCRPSASP